MQPRNTHTSPSTWDGYTFNFRAPSKTCLEDPFDDYPGENNNQDMSTEEFRIELIRSKLEDTLRDLGDARESPIWAKLDFVSPWAAHIKDLIRTSMDNNTDKHIIGNLAETNTYLTRKITELECKPSNPRPETPQPHRTTNNNRPTQTPAQTSWAQVVANAHQKTPAQPAKPPTRRGQQTHTASSFRSAPQYQQQKDQTESK